MYVGGQDEAYGNVVHVGGQDEAYGNVVHVGVRMKHTVMLCMWGSG